LGSWLGGVGITTCEWFFSSSIIGCVGQFGEFFIRYIAFLIRWYVEWWLFHFFWNILGQNPPCCDVRFVSSGIGGALHVSWILLEIFVIRRSNFVHVVCH
jgi:hypothetical protein